MSAKYVQISEDIVDDETKLAREAVKHFGNGFDKSKVKFDVNWKSNPLFFFDARPTECLIIFRQPPSRELFDCIRVKDASTGAVYWEATNKTGTWMGFIPINHKFEAMLVELKLITRIQEGDSS